jgi:hypothetical protein
MFAMPAMPAFIYMCKDRTIEMNVLYLEIRMKSLKRFCDSKRITKAFKLLDQTKYDLENTKESDIDEKTRQRCLNQFIMAEMFLVMGLFNEVVAVANNIATDSVLTNLLIKKRLDRLDADVGDLGALPMDIRRVIGGFI